MNNIRDLACDELREDFENLKEMELGSKEWEIAVEGITKMQDRVIQIDKLAAEAKQEQERQNTETQLKLKQMKQERIDRWVGFGITAFGIVLPAVVKVWGARTAWTFELDRYVGSPTSKKMIDDIISSKK